MKTYLTTDDVATRLHVCIRQVRYLCTQGRLAYQKVGSSFVVDPDSVAEYLRQQENKPALGKKRGRPAGSGKNGK